MTAVIGPWVVSPEHVVALARAEREEAAQVRQLEERREAWLVRSAMAAPEIVEHNRRMLARADAEARIEAAAEVRARREAADRAEGERMRRLLSGERLHSVGEILAECARAERGG